MKTQVRKVRQAVAAGDIATAETELRLAAKKLDRAGVKRVIHPNAAARTKSRLAHLIRGAKKAAGGEISPLHHSISSASNTGPSTHVRL